VSYVNIAKAIAPIAKNIGDDVVRGMSKADDVVDDWGWKGGKPGEVTAGELIKNHYGDVNAYQDFGNKILKSNSRLGDKARGMTFYMSNGTTKKPQPYEIASYFVRLLSSLEKAGIPRKWTGKLAADIDEYRYRAFSRTGSEEDYYSIENLPMTISKNMEPLTNSQREKFVTLLPEYEGTLEELAKTVKLL